MILCADVMVLNDIIEQAAGRQSGASDHGGKREASYRVESLQLKTISEIFSDKEKLSFHSNLLSIYTPSQFA